MMRIRMVALALVAAAGVTCKDEGPTPGTSPPANPTSLVVALTTPNADDGAMMVTVRGPGMATVVSSSASYLVFSNLTVQNQARVIAVGDLKAGAIFTVAVAGANPLSDYSVTLDQGASRTDALRTNLANYKVTLSAGSQ
jgi:hypothetical protein